MDLSAFIVSVFCPAEDFLKGRRLRSRGPAPRLSDSEVLTMEMVGEFLGVDTDKAIHERLRRHYGEWSPAAARVHRAAFCRQAANLWKVKEELWRSALHRELPEGASELFMVGSFPMAVCEKARSRRRGVVAELSGHGRDTVGGGFFYGVRAHMLVVWPGIIAGASPAPANVHDLTVAEELLEGAGGGWALADRNYFSRPLSERLRQSGGMRLLAQRRHTRKEKEKGLRWPGWLVQKRRRIETVFSQLAGRFKTKKVWARDTWRPASRSIRKILSHTIAVFMRRALGLRSLRLSELLIH
ncbi:MAG: IS982 family transposase [Actinomycetota bacterium]|jgi:hypothetical protein|nr:IS982 family transposase [Actinomycetota bacterium]